MTIVVIPIGGIGQRFKTHSYPFPKSLTLVHGKPILFYLIDTILLHPEKPTHILIPYHREYKEYLFEQKIKHYYPQLNFIFLPLQYDTQGSAHTIFLGLSYIKQLNIPDSSFISLDSDSFYNQDLLQLWNNSNTIFYTHDSGNIPQYSYIQINESDHTITDIQEKQSITKNACTGAYAFKSYKLFIELFKMFVSQYKSSDEIYVSQIIQFMISNNITFTAQYIPSENWICLGTPQQVLSYCNTNLPKNKLRICYDLDNTLVTYPSIRHDYTTVQPIKKNIALLRKMKHEGHTIIIYTARRMKTHGQNIGKCIADIGLITINTLNKFNIPYDELHFGKPYADLYIDDNAFNPYINLQKHIGYFKNEIKPRHFNKITIQGNNIIKSSKNIYNEIFYYLNIPKNIKHLFPTLIDYDKINHSSITIDKINGITASQLIVQSLLTERHLNNILNTINLIHNTEHNFDNDNIDIHFNLLPKLNQRITQYDTCKIMNFPQIHTLITDTINEYTSMNKHKISIIHGDPVLTNIFIDNFNSIRFIDMRGHHNNKYTLLGDPIYDYAKIYQSLIGYDWIIHNNINENTPYQEKLIHIFMSHFTKIYEPKYIQYLKAITLLLILSMIPLHDNQTHVELFIQLLQSKYLII